MNIKKILSDYLESDKERQIGRYYASEVSSVIKGYKKPKDFFVKEKLDEKAIGNILSGRAFEAEFKRALDHSKVEYQHEPKEEIKVDDFVIVVKPDFVFKDKIIETKFPVRLGHPEDYLERYKHQMECEFRAFNKPVYLGIFSHPFDVKVYRYQESDQVWQEVIDYIRDFNKKLYGNISKGDDIKITSS